MRDILRTKTGNLKYNYIILTKTMHPTIQFEELAFHITANNHNPRVLTPHFLKSKNIIPRDWEFAQESSAWLDSRRHQTEIHFTNGAIISTQCHGATFSQIIQSEIKANIKIPDVVRNYIQALNNLDYEMLDINFTTFVTFEDSNDKFQHYIASQLLSSGSWQEYGKEPLLSTLNLEYTLERGKLRLKIDDVKLRNSNDILEAGALFCSNFSYEIPQKNSTKINFISSLIDNWQYDIFIYQELVKERFLKKSVNS